MNRRFEKEDARMTEMPEQEEAIYFQLGGAEAAMPAGKTVIEYRLPVSYTHLEFFAGLQYRWEWRLLCFWYWF